jgi:hypothetical protein
MRQHSHPKPRCCLWKTPASAGISSGVLRPAFDKLMLILSNSSVLSASPSLQKHDAHPGLALFAIALCKVYLGGCLGFL